MAKTALISVDGHVKASRHGYRDYLEKKYLEAYDEQVLVEEAAGLRDAGNLHPDLDPAVQWDADLRIAHLERMGVVAEVLYPNGQPFQVNPLDDHPRADDEELAAAGRHAYNRWLIDFCAVAPDRFCGQMQVSFRDVDRAVEDVYWAKEHGLGGIMLPEMTADTPVLIDSVLDPIWAALNETGLTIGAHGGASLPSYGSGFGAMVSVLAENAFYSNRSAWMLIAAGVFDRCPNLRLCYVETQPYLLVAALEALDQMIHPSHDWMAFARTIDRAETTILMPSEYLGRNIFVGISPFSPLQVPFNDLVGKDPSGAKLPGLHIGAGASLFGVDYPQFESIFDRTMAEVAALVTTPGVSEDDTRRILFDNAADLYAFDVDALAPQIERIGFEIADVRGDAAALARSAPHTTKAPLLATSAARAAVRA